MYLVRFLFSQLLSCLWYQSYVSFNCQMTILFFSVSYWRYDYRLNLAADHYDGLIYIPY